MHIKAAFLCGQAHIVQQIEKMREWEWFCAFWVAIFFPLSESIAADLGHSSASIIGYWFCCCMKTCCAYNFIKVLQMWKDEMTWFLLYLTKNAKKPVGPDMYLAKAVYNSWIP